MQITYGQQGDYMLPNLKALDGPPPSFSKYGRMRQNHLKNHCRAEFVSLLTSGKLPAHLAEVDRAAEAAMARIVQDMKLKEGVTEDLKARDQMAWVGAMNSIMNRAEEVVLAEYVYA